MIDWKNVKALLFDSGRVLNYPRTGHWHIPPNIFKYIDKKAFDSIPNDQLSKAFKLGLKFLDDNHYIQTEAEELDTFIQFYKIIFNELNQIKTDNETITNISMDTVFNNEKFVFFEDVYEFIPMLEKRFLLGVVSDTWPSLERVYKDEGLMKYFTTFVMSSVLGVCKPNELMYTTALNGLGVKPEETLFIDDSYDNCMGAESLGIKSILMTRETWSKDGQSDIVGIGDLNDLYKMIDPRE